MLSFSRRTLIVVVAGVLLAATVAVILLTSGASSTRYYVALGDSLSVGIQPNAKGDQLITDTGYVNDLYAHYAREIPELKLVQMGCPGDDTENVISGQANPTAAKLFHCDRAGGSQLNAAVAFIRAHSAQVKLVSIDIGTNDVLDCLSPTVYDKGLRYTVSCIKKGERSIATNMPRIVGALKSVTAPHTALVGGDLYDPFLSGLLIRNRLVNDVADQSVTLISKINSEVAAADTNAGFRTADVAGAFFTDSTRKVKSPLAGGTAQRNLVVLCRYTYVCAHAPQGPNVHPDTVGYSAIAKAYERALRSL
jgi:lysophospholipase L1-like esterase